MQGLPKAIGTKRDVENLADMASRGEIDRASVGAMLDNLLATRQHLVLKEESVNKPVEELTTDDYRSEADPNSQMKRLGLTVTEINRLKGGL
jgi:hypothetical protein